MMAPLVGKTLRFIFVGGERLSQLEGAKPPSPVGRPKGKRLGGVSQKNNSYTYSFLEMFHSFYFKEHRYVYHFIAVSLCSCIQNR